MSDQQRLHADDFEAAVASMTLPGGSVASGTADGEPRDGGVGLEVELFPVRWTSEAPTGRVPVADTAEALSTSFGPPADGPDPRFRLEDGGWISFEPGGQLEISTAYRRGVVAAVTDADRISARCGQALATCGVGLLATGTDLWHPHPAVPQQLRAGRYPAMARYLDGWGPAGGVMMRHTCALQINLDVGAELADRWVVANLLAPMLVATFAASPAPSGAVGGRTLVWLATDPTRTGCALGSGEDPLGDLCRAAAQASVLLVDTPAGTRPGQPGFSFGRWLREGHPEWGWPTVEDLRQHLTTLFHEVRLRGWLELRSTDALPARWRPVPVLLCAGALYDPVARGRIREVLEPHRGRLRALLRRAAHLGVADPELCAAAVATWSYALEGATRIGVPRRLTDLAASFLDRCTLRGRTPADELRALLAEDPAAAAAWASEPVPSGTW